MFSFKEKKAGLARVSNIKSVRGFTLVEIIIAISIMAILLGLSLKSWSSFSDNKKVETAAVGVVSVFDSARVSAISSKNAQVYGVNVASTSIALYGGSVFNIADPSNEVVTLDGVLIATTSLSGGVSDVSFSRFTGLPSATGTLYLVSKKDSSIVKILQISDSGLVKIL